MHRHPNLLLMGQDIADYGGVFKVTEGFLEEFGKERIRNTPLCESAVIGAAFGLQIAGYQSVVEMQFADFIRSEEHTSELPSLMRTSYAVFCLKKKTTTQLET